MQRKLMILFTTLVLFSLMIAPVGRASAQESGSFGKNFPIHRSSYQPGPGTASITPTITGNLVQDPSFEASYNSTAYWGQYSTNFGTPLCIPADCGNGLGTAGPHSGNVWGWFGGTTLVEQGDIWQDVTFPRCGATLQFYFWIGRANSGSDASDYFVAAIDGNAVFSANATQKNSYASYKLVSVNVNAYADGGVHEIEFFSQTSGQIVTFNLDDVSLIGTCPTISGNAGVAGATLNYTGGSTSADGSGNYAFNVPPGWSGTVTPSKADYVFSPTNRTYTNVVANQTAQNYTATPLYSVSGNTVIAGVTLSYTDGTPKTVTSQSNGNYSLSVLNNWSGTVTPTHPCITFSPVNRSYSNIASNQTAQDYTPTFNPVSGCADVNVVVGGTNQGRFGIPSQGSTRASFSGLNNGPVKIVSTNAISLIGAERVIYKVNGVNTSFSELMALPNSQLNTIFWLPWYNNVDLDTQLRFANVSGSTAAVHVFIGGVEMSGSPFTLAPGESTRQSFAVNNGPVKIVSDQNIVAAERVIYKVNGVNTSFSELMALPNSQLNTIFWLPWYNNVDLDTQLRFGAP